MDTQSIGNRTLNELFSGRQRVLVTGGAGFIGGCLVRRLLNQSNVEVFNLDKCGYASDLKGVESCSGFERHHLLKVDLSNSERTKEAVFKSDPDLVFHLAAESHVDRSIDGPASFVDSNVLGTFNLLQAVCSHWEKLEKERRKSFRLLHISTDEVFGSLSDVGLFSESTPYDPRSPYAATKAASDHLVSAWNHTYGLPVVRTNCSNNYGPWQFPEKLIPLSILKAVSGSSIPIYGNGENIRDWLFVEDHVDALLLAAIKGVIGKTYCVGGNNQKTNKEVIYLICDLLDQKNPKNAPHRSLIKYVKDRPGHDFRYAIDPTLIRNELGWKPTYSFLEGIEKTIDWYLDNLQWTQDISRSSGYFGQRIGVG